MDTKTCFVYSTNEFSGFLEGITVSPLMKCRPSSDPVPISGVSELSAADLLNDLAISDTLYCSYCSAGFLDKHQQRAHYKLDWHRYNLKQHLAQKKTISEDKFAQLADDVSSISGSESDSDTETDLSSTDVESSKDDALLTHLIARRSRVLFNNSSGQVISVHRCLLLNKKEEAASDDHLVDLIKKLPNRTTWLIIMMGGGHFAAALFKGTDAVLHKTFHSYTVRSKQGGAQSSKDGKGSHPKSAGASLRRYNEQSHLQHIQDLMKAWAPDIVKCDMIFYRAVGRGNTGILFGGPHPPLLRSDPRVRTIPFPTRRATFNEVKRVHGLLSTAFIYDSNEMFRTTFSPPAKETTEPSEKKWTKCSDCSPKGSPRKNNIDRAKERPSPIRELPDIVQQLAAISTSGSEGDLAFIDEELSFVDSLKEFDDTVPQHIKDRVKKGKPKKKKREVPEDDKEVVREDVQELWNAIHSSCLEGDFEKLKYSLENKKPTITSEDLSTALNQKNILGETILHNMSAAGKGDAVRLLMLYGADPNARDKKTQTPYDHATEKSTRNVFRRFRGEFPEMYDYSKTHIPDALTEELEAEIAEKKRLAKKAKRQKDKERRIAAETNKREDDEKKRFLKLSDREKRALAAERRVLSAAGRQGTVVLSRCYDCATDITGKVPFEYSDKRFCSMACLKKHRAKEKKQ